MSGRSNPDVTRLLERQSWDALIPHLLKVEANVETATAALRTFTERLLQWNRSVSNLISRNDEGRFVDRHLMEAVEPAHWLRSSGATRWIDLGSGGGIPAIPLALVMPGTAWTLVESRRTKTLFLRKVTEELGLTSVETVNSRVEDVVLEREHMGAFDGFTSRATLPLGPTLAYAAMLTRPGGHAFLWKGSRREEEMAADPAWREHWDLDGLLGIGSGQTVVTRFIRK